MKNIAMIQDYNCIIPGALAIVATDDTQKQNDYIASWAEDDFRSVNGQIEYLLTECVRQRKKNGKYVSDELDIPPELDNE